MPTKQYKIRPASIKDVGHFLLKVYESDKKLQRYSGMEIEEGLALLGFFRKQEKGRLLGVIGLSEESSPYTIVHEAVHAAMEVARRTKRMKELGYAREFWEAVEEEEWLCTLIEEITEEIMEKSSPGSHA